VLIPIVYSFWMPRRLDPDNGNFFDNSLEKIMKFDAIHFKGAAQIDPYQGGYRFETNQAFFPFFPYIINGIVQALNLG